MVFPFNQSRFGISNWLQLTSISIQLENELEWMYSSSRLLGWVKLIFNLLLVDALIRNLKFLSKWA